MHNKGLLERVKSKVNVLDSMGMPKVLSWVVGSLGYHGDGFFHCS
jgi:hypothetical protein